jgi:Protein of unknown function (DUF3309)
MATIPLFGRTVTETWNHACAITAQESGQRFPVIGIIRKKESSNDYPAHDLARDPDSALLLGALPTWPYSRNWGYFPSGGLALVVVILVILWLLGYLG